MLVFTARTRGGAPPLVPADPNVDTTALDSIVRVAQEQAGLAGLNVAIARGDTVLWAGAAGEAALERHVPAGTETVYGLMSISSSSPPRRF